MSNYNTNASVNLQVNGQQAANMLQQLKQRAFDLENAIAKAAAAGQKTNLGRLRRELTTTNRQIREMQSEASQVESVLLRLDKSTPKELNRTLSVLNKQLQNIERGSAAWNAQTTKIKQVKDQLRQMNAELSIGQSKWDKFNNWMNNVQATAFAGVAALTGLVMAGRKAVNAYAEMEEQLANTRKYTGMAESDVLKMNDAFKNIDTRTPREKLNELAQEAGRLGKNTQESVQGYVEAADIINVALVDLGEGATQSIAKLTNIFGVEQMLGTRDAMLSVGSTVNVLSQNCTASKPYIVDFTERMAGIGAQSKMSIPEIMAFAATLDANGQKVEMSASAIGKMIMNLFQRPGEIAKQVGLDVEQFTSTLNKSTNEGLMMFLQRIHEMGSKDGLAVLAPMFKDLGMDGVRMSQVLASLAEHLDMVKWEQVEANKAFTEASSATREYNIFNNTTQAGIDKAKNRMHELAVELGEKLLPLYKHIMTSSSMMIRLINVIVTFIIENKTAIITLTVAIVAYSVAANIATIKTKALAAAQAIAKAATAAWTVAQSAANVALLLFKGRLHAARQEFVLMSATMKANPWGLLIAAITAVAGGLYMLITRQEKVIDTQKELQKIEDKALEQRTEEKTKIDLLVAAAKNEKLSLSERHTAIEKLNNLIPNYNAQLDDTTGKYKENKKALDKYLDSLARKYELEGAKDKLREIGKTLASLYAENGENVRNRDEAEKEAAKQVSNPNPRTSGGAIMPSQSQGQIGMSGEVTAYTRKILDTNEAIAEQKRLRNDILGKYGESLQKDAILNTGGKEGEITQTVIPGPINNNSEVNTDKFAAEKEWKEREEALNRIAYATGKKNLEEYNDSINEINLEFYKKQLVHADLSYKERLEIEAQLGDESRKTAEAAQEKSIDYLEYCYDEELATIKQFYVDGQISLDTYNEMTERAEITHLGKLANFYSDGSEKKISAEKAYRDKLLSAQEKKRKETEKTEQEHQKELERIKKDYFGDNAAEKKASYDKVIAGLTEVYNAEIEAAEDNAAEKLRIEEAFQKAKTAIAEKYEQDSSDKKVNAFKKANDDIVAWLDSDGGKKVTETMDIIASGMSSIFSQMTTSVQAELEIQTAAIEKKYDSEISRAEGNNYKIKKLEEKKEKEIAKAKNDANRKMFAMQVIQAVAETSQAAINAYASASKVSWILGPIAAAMAVAAGTMQIANIKKQQQASESQGYAEGGFTPKGDKYKEVGVVHAGEWVASQKLLASPVARPMIEALDYAQRSNTIGSLCSADVAVSVKAPSATTRQDNGGDIMEMLQANAFAIAAYADTMRKLESRLNEPFVTVNTVTGDKGINKAQEEYNRLMINKSSKYRQ